MPNALVTGSNLSLGLALVRTALANGWKLLATVRSTTDMTVSRALAGDD